MSQFPKKKRKKAKSSLGLHFNWRPIAGVFAILLGILAALGLIMTIKEEGPDVLARRGGGVIFVLAMFSVGINWLRGDQP